MNQIFKKLLREWRNSLPLILDGEDPREFTQSADRVALEYSTASERERFLKFYEATR